MIPLSDDNPTLRTPIVTYLLLGVIGATWVFVQGAGLNSLALFRSVWELGLIPGELTRLAPVGLRVPLGGGLSCGVDDAPARGLLKRYVQGLVPRPGGHGPLGSRS